MMTLYWILSAVLLALLPAASMAQDLERHKAGVVKITASSEGKRKTGTGFLVRLEPDAAYILTASHVVEGDNEPQVEFFTRRNLAVRAQTARLEGGDPRGLALLIVKDAANLPRGIRALPISSSARLQGGAQVTAIGFPQGAGPWAVLRATIVSLDGRDLTIDGSIDEGSSGGPVLAGDEVVGVITTVQGRFARAVPAALAKLVLEGWGVTAQASGTVNAEAKPAAPSDGGAAKQPQPQEPASSDGTLPQGALRILHAACERLRTGTSYRVVLRGEGQGPAGAVLRTALWHAERQVSAAKPACKDWQQCQRRPQDPEKTGWTLSVLTAGAAPTEARVILEPVGSAGAAYATASAQLDCMKPW
jgi:hypothetical protein